MTGFHGASRIIIFRKYTNFSKFWTRIFRKINNWECSLKPGLTGLGAYGIWHPTYGVQDDGSYEDNVDQCAGAYVTYLEFYIFWENELKVYSWLNTSIALKCHSLYLRILHGGPMHRLGTCKLLISAFPSAIVKLWLFWGNLMPWGQSMSQCACVWEWGCPGSRW